MLKCPNKSHPDWKALVEKTGSEINAYKEYIKNGMEIPNIDDLKGETKIKPGVPELFKSNLELVNAVYSKILTNSGLSAENLLSLLLKDNLIEKQCS